MRGVDARIRPPEAVRLLHDPGLSVFDELVHGFAERAGGVSAGPYTSLNLGPRSGDDPGAVSENRRRLLAALGIEACPVCAPRQVHSADVAVLRAGEVPAEAAVFPGDGLATDTRGVALLVLAADCVPVLLYDPARHVIAAAHAGWRGTAGGIAGRAVEVMREQFGCVPADVRVALGPAIGRCCYEVGPEVLAAVAAATPGPAEALYDPLPAGKGRLDLIAANVAQLVATGVPAHAIGTSGLCTACHGDRFFSHRRDGEPTGRGAAVIALRP